jgi:hypothetical protein
VTHEAKRPLPPLPRNLSLADPSETRVSANDYGTFARGPASAFNHQSIAHRRQKDRIRPIAIRSDA